MNNIQTRTALKSNRVEPWLEGKRILVTGAAGSVGSAVCERLANASCAAMAVVDQNDHGLLSVVERTRRINSALDVTEVLCNIRDSERVTSWMNRFRPDVVIHAAALKHVHVGEGHPGECVLTNLIGMRNVLLASAAAEVGAFIQISTDKAASPVCVMGATKRLAELYMRGFNLECSSSIQLKAVRFGNVMGSQGSVAPRFAEQIAAGGPLEITHPKMQRYFMNINEATDLILKVAAYDEAAEPRCGIYYRDMGEPIFIADLARDMMDAAGREVPVHIKGIRPGEKLKEELFDQYEDVHQCGLPGIYRVTPISTEAYVASSDLARIEQLARSGEDQVVRQSVFALLDARLGREILCAG